MRHLCGFHQTLCLDAALTGNHYSRQMPLSFPDSEVMMYPPAVSAFHRRGLSVPVFPDDTRLRHSLYRSYLLVVNYSTFVLMCQLLFLTKYIF